MMQLTTLRIKSKEFFFRLLYAPGVTPLPLGKTTLFFIIFLLNAMVTSMVFAYLPKLVRSFGTKEEEVGANVGYIASSMFAGQIIFSLFWGYAGEKVGKLMALALSCFGVSIATFLFAFSKDFWWTFVTRFLQGTWCVYVTGINAFLETTDKYNRPVAVTLSLTAYAVGLIIGPSIGGYLVFLSEQYPEAIKTGSFLDKYGTFLPNAIIGFSFALCGFVIMIIIRTERKRSKPYFVGSEEKIPLVEAKKSTFVKSNPGIVKTLSVILRSKRCLLSCSIMFLFNMVAIAFNEVYPVWADSTKKYHGLEMTTAQIGKSLMIAASVVIVIQPATMSQLFARFGTKKVLIASFVLQVLLYPLYPPIAYIENNRLLIWFLLCLNIIVTRLAVGASFIGVAVIVNNSVPTEYSGSANGFGNTTASFGRLLAPTMFGRLYSWTLGNITSINKDGLGFPFDQNLAFLLLSLILIVTMILTLFVKEEIPDSRAATSGDERSGTGDC